MTNKHTISVLVENEFGVLARVAGMFAARGYNIDSLSVAPTLGSKISHMTIVTHGSEEIIEQILKQLNRLIDVIEVSDLTGVDFVNRQTVLVKVKSSEDHRSEILRIAELFRAEVVDAALQSTTLQLTGEDEKIDSFLATLNHLGILELVRTGTIAIQVGAIHEG